MDDKIKVLLDRINIDENSYQYFNSAKISKIKVNSKIDSWLVFIEIDDLLPVEVYSELEEKKMALDKNASSIEFIFDVKNFDIEKYLEYYKYLLTTLKKDLRVLEIYEDCMRIENEFLVLVVSTPVEKKKLDNCLDKINHFYKCLGYKFNIEVVVRHEENVLEEIQKELENVELPKVDTKKKVVEEKPTEKKYNRREAKDPNNVIGRGIKEDPIKIKTIIGEDPNVVIEGKVFGVDFFESTKTDFKIITLKVTDFTDSIYCKVFVREEEEYKRLSKELKPGNWYKIRGYTKTDQFSNNELVLNARDIILIDKKESSVEDTAEVKRVELHCHTKMSQMDGVADECDVVKTAMGFGMNAVAITDHNGVQGFPHVFGMVTGYNKKLEEGQKPFKAIYGAELVMIDDAVDIVVRPNDSVMLEDEFVVFDFETTGFNAGGADSIIEIGAVKLKDGMIVDRFDELINPGRPLPQKIVELTNITDQMLEDKDTEENAVKRFIEWFGEAPMVAHNAKFDVSFLEMAYKKYNLGTFTNPDRKEHTSELQSHA